MFDSADVYSNGAAEEVLGGLELHGGPSGVKLVPILRGYERVGY